VLGGAMSPGSATAPDSATAPGSAGDRAASDLERTALLLLLRAATTP
jgi:hypothetical protein